jgi:hypothetical protein
MATVNNLWSNGQNWSLGAVPGVNDSATFDGGQQPIGQGNNKPVTVDVTTVCNDVTFQNNYTATMTVNAGVTLETKNGFNLSNQNLGGAATVDFKSTTSKLLADASGATLKNFNFIDQRGTFTISTGSLTVSPQAASSSTADFVIGGSFSLNTSVTVTFKGGAGITIAVGGSMIIVPANATVLSDNLDGGIIENWGTFNYTGIPGNTTEVDMAFLNHNQATLIAGAIKFLHNSNATQAYAIMMDNGTLSLESGIAVTAYYGYLQTGGTLTVPDSADLFLQKTLLGLGGRADINGGNITLGGAPPFTFGTLTVGGNLNFNGGEYDAKIDGAPAQGASSSDEIHVMGNLTIAGNSKLKVTVNGGGAVNQGQTWDIMDWTGTITGDFAAANKSFPPHVSGPDPNQLFPNGVYRLFYVP